MVHGRWVMFFHFSFAMRIGKCLASDNGWFFVVDLSTTNLMILCYRSGKINFPALIRCGIFLHGCLAYIVAWLMNNSKYNSKNTICFSLSSIVQLQGLEPFLWCSFLGNIKWCLIVALKYVDKRFSSLCWSRKWLLFVGAYPQLMNCMKIGFSSFFFVLCTTVARCHTCLSSLHNKRN